MGYEKFTNKGRGFKPQVSIWSRGQIGFNRGAVNICKISEGTNVVFFYSSDQNRIGFQFTMNSSEEGAFKLKTYDTGAIVSAKAFLEYYRINYEITRKYELFYDEASNMYYIDLGKETPKKDGVEVNISKIKNSRKK